MRVFRKRKEQPLTSGQQRLAERIAVKILSAQRQAADYLNYLTAGVSRGNWIFMLISFCLAFGSYCLSLLIQAF